MEHTAPAASAPDDSLDLKGLKCPLPALLARKALARLAPGAPLIVLADDPMALVDIPHMCHREGHALESVARHDTHAAFHIRARVLRPEVAAPEEGQPPQAGQAAPPRGQDG